MFYVSQGGPHCPHELEGHEGIDTMQHSGSIAENLGVGVTLYVIVWFNLKLHNKVILKQNMN